MSTQDPVTPVTTPTPQTTAGQPIGSARAFVLACLGLVSLLADEVPALLERSVQRGGQIVEQAQAEAKQRRHVPQTIAPQTIAPQVRDEWLGEMTRWGLLSHHDLERLLQQVTDLERQIDQIATQRAARAATDQPSS